MKKVLCAVITLVFVLSLGATAYSASADTTQRSSLDWQSLSNRITLPSTSKQQEVTYYVVPQDGGTVTAGKSSDGSQITYTANENDGYEFVGWYTDLSGTSYSSDKEITVDANGDIKMYFAVFSAVTESTSSDESSTSFTIPSGITLPTSSSTDPTSSTEARSTNAPSSVTATNNAITADSAKVERASNYVSQLADKLADANKPKSTTVFSFETTTEEQTTAAKSNKPKKTSIKKLTPQKKGFKVTWAKVTSAKGYQIKYSASSKFTKKTSKTITVKNSSTTSKTVKKLKGKKKYYVKVRTYKTVNGKKVYSSWSKVKTVKTK